ncbi:MAG: hypothetical protein J6X20_01520, partial [Bacteroidales bacterium]|nr:hypothetical protein [Bacteroidales bacterium]
MNNFFIRDFLGGSAGRASAGEQWTGRDGRTARPDCTNIGKKKRRAPDAMSGASFFGTANGLWRKNTKIVSLNTSSHETLLPPADSVYGLLSGV